MLLLLHPIAEGSLTCSKGLGKALIDAAAICVWEHDRASDGRAILVGVGPYGDFELALGLSGHLVSLHEAEILRASDITLVDDVIVAADRILFLTSIQSERREVDIAGTNECQSRLLLLIALKLGVHNVELKQGGAIEDVVEVLFAQRNSHLVVATLPVWIATLVDDVGLEVVVLADNSIHLGRPEPDVGVRRLHLVHWVE